MTSASIATPIHPRKLVTQGFRAVSEYPDRQRQAEGFN
jgi:hypothetical protein